MNSPATGPLATYPGLASSSPAPSPVSKSPAPSPVSKSPAPSPEEKRGGLSGFMIAVIVVLVIAILAGLFIFLKPETPSKINNSLSQKPQ